MRLIRCDKCKTEVKEGKEIIILLGRNLEGRGYAPKSLGDTIEWCEPCAVAMFPENFKQEAEEVKQGE